VLDFLGQPNALEFVDGASGQSTGDRTRPPPQTFRRRRWLDCLLVLAVGVALAGWVWAAWAFLAELHPPP
jgi:hypothetical protein